MEFHAALASILQKQGSLNEAVAEYREAYVINGMVVFLQVLSSIGKPGEALTIVRERLRNHPEETEGISGLSYWLLCVGALEEAIAFDREAIRLQKEQPGSEIQVHLRQIERLSALEERLDAILRGQDAPANAEGRLDLADLCRVKGRFAAATRFYREAFQTKSALAGDLSTQHLLHAAIAAAQAGTQLNPAKDVPPLDEAERARWRSQALDWLRAEKDVCAKIIGAEITGQPNANRPPNDAARKLRLARKTLEILTHHRDLACVREPDALAKLTQGERKDWQAFWAEVDRVLKKANP
jgi:tetratricopeptide (TPR) repeat protein